MATERELLVKWFMDAGIPCNRAEEYATNCASKYVDAVILSTLSDDELENELGVAFGDVKRLRINTLPTTQAPVFATTEETAEFVHRARCSISTTTTKDIVEETNGYMFGRVISYVSHATVVLEAKNVNGIYCAKVGPNTEISSEVEIAKSVRGPYVMSVLDSFPISGGRAALITPRYGSAMSWWLSASHPIVDEIVVSTLLCGMSATYSFASQGFCHNDIKLENMVEASNREVIVIDFGSAGKIGADATLTTPFIGMNQKQLTIGYDVTSLAVAAARLIVRDQKILLSVEELLSNVRFRQSTYPVAVETLETMPIDKEICSVTELLRVWRKLYDVVKEKMPTLVSQFPNFAPPC